jgi:putative FmdB family regulatory protein
MPTYEYSCNSCGQHLEVVQSFTDDSLTECPNCGGALRKVFGNIGIVLKGSGFYKTDSRPKAGAKKGAAESGSDKATASSSSSGDGSSGNSSSASDSGGGSSTANAASSNGSGKSKDTASSTKAAGAS